MKNTLSLLALSLALVAPLAAGPQQPSRASDARSRDLYVSVVDREGAAVKGLTAADFTVREDGVAREVLKVMPAEEPLQIVLLVDDSQSATSAVSTQIAAARRPTRRTRGSSCTSYFRKRPAVR